MPLTELDTVTDPDGRHRVQFYRDERGLYRFTEWRWDEDDLTKFGLGVRSGWVPLEDSGLYLSLEEARRGALELGWFRALVDTP